MPNELRESLALLPCCSKPWIWIAKPVKSGIKKFICRRSVPTGALSVERPAKNQIRRTIMFGGHPSQPMINQRRFSDPSPSNDCNDVDTLVCPGTIQKSNILLSPENIAPRDRQFGH